MKRLLIACSMLLLALAAGNPAQAQTPPTPLPNTCVKISGTATSEWPNGNYSANCGGNPIADAQSMVTGVTNSQAFGFNNLAKQGIQLFLFTNPTAYATALGTKAAPNIPNTAWSVTSFDSNNRPIHIAVFEKNKNGASIPNGTVAHYSVREAGRAIDSLLGYVRNLGIETVIYPAISEPAQEFDSTVTEDWRLINLMPLCGNNSVFGGKIDPIRPPAGTHYICTGPNGTGNTIDTYYATTLHENSAQAIITNFYPDVFTTANDIWAEEYAIRRNGPIQGLDTYLGGFSLGFHCSYQYQNVVEQQGRKPTSADWNGPGLSTCPALAAPPTITVGANMYPAQCIQLFSHGGGDSSDYSYPSWGYVFLCGSAGGGNTASVASNLWYMNAAYRTALYKANSFIYLTTSGGEYNTIWIAAKQPRADLTGQGTLAASTYPVGAPANGTLANSIWFTITFMNTELGGNGQPYPPFVTYTATHELGHTFDDTRSVQTSSTPAYDTAMQNDWAKLDYRTYPSVQVAPCATIGNQGYTGPLTGVIDVVTKANFCDGNGGFAAGSAKWGNINPATPGKKWLTSDILRDPSEFGFSIYAPLLYQPLATKFVGGFPGIKPKAGWREWHSEALAITLQTAVGSTPFDPAYAQIAANGYFVCTAGPGSWAALEVSTGKAVTTGPAGCLAANLPAGWVVIH